MRSLRGGLLALLAIVGSPGCGGGGDGAAPPDETEAPAPDCSKIVVPTYAVLASGTFSHCVVCHSSKLTGAGRQGATDAVNFDTYDQAKLAAPIAYGMVKNRKMPPPNGEGLTNAERNRLYEWVLCGTPP